MPSSKAISKDPVPGRCVVRRLNLDGDGQGDLAGHGGEQRAVFVYQMDSYRHWQEHLGRDDFTYGQFGENLTVDGLADGDVLLLCTDGLFGVVADERIAELLESRTQPLDAICRALVDSANAAGGPDNITALIVQIDAP